MTPNLTDIHNRTLPGLTGPCRRTDVLIGVAMAWRHVQMGTDMLTLHSALGTPIDEMVEDTRRSTSILSHLPHWTASLDDGIKLIPDGFSWSSYHRQDGDGACRVSLTGNACTVTRYAATPALAMLTAAIGARITGGRFDR